MNQKDPLTAFEGTILQYSRPVAASRGIPSAARAINGLWHSLRAADRALLLREAVLVETERGRRFMSPYSLAQEDIIALGPGKDWTDAQVDILAMCVEELEFVAWFEFRSGSDLFDVLPACYQDRQTVTVAELPMASPQATLARFVVGIVASSHTNWISFFGERGTVLVISGRVHRTA
jgi:hypothetical protein